MKKEKNIMARIFQNPWFGGLVIFAFASFISAATVNSYFADKHKLNTVFIIAAIVFGLAAIICLAKANATSTGTEG